MLYGMGWLEQQYKLCMEGMRFDYAILTQVIPLARTPMDKKSGKAMEKFAKDVQKALSRILTPWEDELKNRMRRHGNVNPGEVTVILGPGEGGLADVFKDSKISSRK